jgi:DNA-3-methyladenine glycosylase I
VSDRLRDEGRENKRTIAVKPDKIGPPLPRTRGDPMPRGGPPPKQKPKNLAGYLEALSRPVFQAGISWRVIDAKWDGIREGFRQFDPPTVAAFGADDVERLLADPAVVRSRPKIEATIDNAQTMIELDAEHRGFRRYLRSHEDFDATVRDLKRNFRYIGDNGAYHFLYVVGEPVPAHEDWFADRPARAERRRR